MHDQDMGRAARPAVYLQADDPVVRGGVAAFLAAAQHVRLVRKDQLSEADIVVVIAGDVTSKTLLMMKTVSRATSGRARVVLVANTISKPQFAQAVGHGMVAFLLRSRTGLNRILRATLDGHRGTMTFPPRLTGALLNQMRAGQHVASSSAPSRAGLTPREIEVLGLLAVGLTTTQIAADLSCSGRDIEDILHATMKRLKLRSHAHAVAHAIRIGAL